MAIMLQVIGDGYEGFTNEYPDKESAIDAYNHLTQDKTIYSITVWDDDNDILIRDYSRG